MHFFIKFILFIVSIPARLKGMKFGKNSYIGPGYDFFAVQLFGIVLGDNVSIGRNAWLQTNTTDDNLSSIIIGNNTSIGRNTTISSITKIAIGENCMISYNVSIFDHDHLVYNKNAPSVMGYLTEGKEVNIGDECFIGAHSFILKGVSLGKRCVVGANSVVTKSFPDNSVVGGSPARPINKI
jgi:lipopolysaccharide O-acetyltransferase